MSVKDAGMLTAFQSLVTSTASVKSAEATWLKSKMDRSMIDMVSKNDYRIARGGAYVWEDAPMNAKGTRSDAAPTIKSSGCGTPKPELSELPAKSK